MFEEARCKVAPSSERNASAYSLWKELSCDKRSSAAAATAGVSSFCTVVTALGAVETVIFAASFKKGDLAEKQ